MAARALCTRLANEKVTFTTASVKAGLIEHDQSVARVAKLHVYLCDSASENLCILTEARVAFLEDPSSSPFADKVSFFLGIVAVLVDVIVARVFTRHVALCDFSDGQSAHITM